MRTIVIVIVVILVMKCSDINSSVVKELLVRVTVTSLVVLNQVEEYVERQKCLINNLALTKQVSYRPEWSRFGI